MSSVDDAERQPVRGQREERRGDGRRARGGPGAVDEPAGDGDQRCGRARRTGPGPSRPRPEARREHRGQHRADHRGRRGQRRAGVAGPEQRAQPDRGRPAQRGHPGPGRHGDDVGLDEVPPRHDVRQRRRQPGQHEPADPGDGQRRRGTAAARPPRRTRSRRRPAISTARSRFATSSTRRRSQRSSSAPANGPTSEYGSSSTASPAATASGSACRSGLNSTAPPSAAWNMPSPHCAANRTPSSRRKPLSRTSRSQPSRSAAGRPGSTGRRHAGGVAGGSRSCPGGGVDTATRLRQSRSRHGRTPVGPGTRTRMRRWSRGGRPLWRPGWARARCSWRRRGCSTRTSAAPSSTSSSTASGAASAWC